MSVDSLKCFFLNKGHFHSSPVNLNTFIPDPSSDTLFGCFYILAYGMAQYETNKHMTNNALEKQRKFKCIEDLQNKGRTCSTNILGGIPLSQYAIQLGTCEYIDLSIFFGLCHAYNIDTAYIYRKRYYSTYIHDDSSEESSKKQIYILNISNIFGEQAIPSYYLTLVDYSSINWNDMYLLHTISNPLPSSKTITKATLLHIIKTFSDTIYDPFIADIDKCKKTHLYEHAKTILKLI
jgi:hypothetical protein